MVASNAFATPVFLHGGRPDVNEIGSVNRQTRIESCGALDFFFAVR